MAFPKFLIYVVSCAPYKRLAAAVSKDAMFSPFRKILGVLLTIAGDYVIGGVSCHFSG